MSFAWPDALPLLLLAPLAWLVLLFCDRARKRRLARWAGERAEKLASDLGTRGTRRLLVSVGLLLALIAVLQPLWGEGPRTIEPRGVEIVVCLDVSRSMLAGDMPPSRLERARREIRALADRARGDRLGLVVFAGEARRIAPLTLDMDSFAELLDRADPLSVERGGTDLGAALEAVTGEPDAVLLLTDGEDHEGRGARAAEEIAKRGIVVHCVGFGTQRGSKIAVEGREAFLRDRFGNEVVSAMDPESLERIAQVTGGVFVDAGASRLPLVEVYEKRILKKARKSLEAELRLEQKNRFQWPLLAAFLLWIMELCLTDRKRI